MRLIKFTIFQLCIFICYDNVKATTEPTVTEPDDDINLEPNTEQGNKNENSLDNDLTEIFKELNIIPNNTTTAPESVTIPKDKWNITRDFPSNEDFDKLYSTSTPSTSNKESHQHVFTDNILPPLPSWATISETEPVNDDSYSNHPDRPSSQNVKPSFESNQVHQQSSWVNKSTNTINQSSTEKKMHSSNYFSSLQSHAIQTISNHRTPPSPPPRSIPQTYLPIPFAHPQNPYSWMQPHCPCQGYYNPFLSYPLQSHTYSDQVHQSNDGLKYKSEYVSSYNNRNSYQNINHS